MKYQYQHPFLAQEVHDDFAREAFSTALAKHLSNHILPGTRFLFDKIMPRIIKNDQHEGKKRTLVRHALLSQPFYQMWSSLKRTNQEMLFDTVGEIVFRQSEELSKLVNTAVTSQGSLNLNPKISTPHYLSKVDIHCMPGGYTVERMEADVSAGAIFDRGIFLYGQGGLGERNDDIGVSVCHWLSTAHHTFRPRSVLDLGCSFGGNTAPYKEAFPSAEVYGTDVGAPLLRYGHARANDLGVSIHFSQQNAESLDFPDNSFDLIVSHLLGHETSLTAYRNIIQECFRLLRSAGMMLHVETDWKTNNNRFNQSLLDWETHYNAEPFKTKLDMLDKRAIASQTGFVDAKIFEVEVPSANTENKYFRGSWSIFGSVKQ